MVLTICDLIRSKEQHTTTVVSLRVAQMFSAVASKHTLNRLALNDGLTDSIGRNFIIQRKVGIVLEEIQDNHNLSDLEQHRKKEAIMDEFIDTGLIAARYIYHCCRPTEPDHALIEKMMAKFKISVLKEPHPLIPKEERDILVTIILTVVLIFHEHVIHPDTMEEESYLQYLYDGIATNEGIILDD